MFSRRSTSPRPFGALLLASSVGVVLTYLLDPSQGRRRRMLFSDKLVHYRRASARLLGKAARDLYNRATGLRLEAKKLWSPAALDDDTLVARARSKLGRYVSHPHAVNVHAARGELTLAGPILEHEARPLVSALQRMRGVHAVHDQLEPHRPEENLPALQGGIRRYGEPAEFLQRFWTPSLKVGAGIAGLGLIGAGVRRPSLSPLALPAGAALILRAALDRPLDAVLGLGDLRDGFEIKKTLTLHAPLERVFALLTSFERYPEFLPHVENVERVANSHYRWTLRGRTGRAVQFESEVVEVVPEQRITFNHVGDRRGEHVAQLRFEPAGEATRVHIDIRYLPRLGAIGLGVRKLLGAHPKRLLDADLVVVKSLFEKGKARVRGHMLTLDDVEQPKFVAPSTPSTPSSSSSP